jgi:hypothetical protein
MDIPYEGIRGALSITAVHGQGEIESGDHSPHSKAASRPLLLTCSVNSVKFVNDVNFK